MAQRLWDSWDADAITADPQGKYASPGKIRSILHDGKHFQVDGPLNVPPSPQGHPVLFQAGASTQGRELATKYAEGIYAVAQLGRFIQQDCSDWVLDKPVPELAPASNFTGPAGRYARILRIVEAEKPTVRQLLGRLAAGGGHCTMVGTPE